MFSTKLSWGSPIQHDVELLDHCPPEEPPDSDWPAQGQPLRKQNLQLLIATISDLVMMLLWLAMLGFAGLIARCNGLNVKDLPYHYDHLTQASTIATTVLPIAFAATIGRFLKQLSQYRVEKGEKMGILNQLVGSTTFIGTLTTQAQLRSWNLITLVLVTTWAFSPLGSQASNRSFSRHLNVTESTTTYPYLDMNNTYNVVGPSSGRISQVVQPNSIFLAAIMSSKQAKESPMDLWGNVKIPALEPLISFGVPDSTGWYAVTPSQTPNISDYASLIGVPIGNITQTGFCTFPLETSYWILSCPLGINYSSAALPSKWYLSTTLANYTGPAMSVWTDRREIVTGDGAYNATNSRYLGVRISDYAAIYTDCTISTSYVEVTVSCQQNNCSATHIRKSQLSHPNTNFTFLDYESANRSPFLENLASVVGGRRDYPSPFSYYIKSEDGINSGSYYASDSNSHDGETELDPKYTFRLAQILNTFWLASIGSQQVSQSRNGNYSTSIITEQDSYLTINMQNTTAKEWTGEPIFVCSIPWLIVLFLAAIIPIAACTGSLVLTYLVRYPSLAMNFSTLARDSRFIQAPVGWSAWDDMDRSRAMMEVRVRFGDLFPKDVVGHIALGMTNRHFGGGKAVIPDEGRRYT